MKAAAVGATWVPKLISALCALALFAETARIVTSLKSPPTPTAAASSTPAGAHESSVSVDAIVNAHLFGAAPAADHSPAEAATHDVLVLVGTIAMGDPARGMAIIGRDALSARAYKAGSSLEDGVLRDIYTDHAVLERDGRLETLWMPRSSLTDMLSHKTTPEVADDGFAEHLASAPGPDQVKERLQTENARVGGALVETALMNMDQFQGLQVESGPDPSILKRLGLKPGDVVQGVDGILIDLDHVDLLRKALAGGRAFQLYVLRPQEGPVNLHVDAAQLQGVVSD